PPDAALRSGRGAADSDRAADHRAQWAELSGTDVLALHAALRDLALHHRVLPRRRARRGRRLLDLAVHLDPARAARRRDAAVPRAPASARAQARPQGCCIAKGTEDNRGQQRTQRVSSSSLTVPEESDGTRLDVFLTSSLAGQSRSQIQRLIKEGHVKVAG